MAITASVAKGFTFATGVVPTPANMNSLGTPVVTVATPIAIANGGTNATSAAVARVQLGLGTMAQQSADSINVNGGEVHNLIILLSSYNVAGLPAADANGYIAFVTDGDGGSPCLGVTSGSAWKRIALGTTVSAT